MLQPVRDSVTVALMHCVESMTEGWIESNAKLVRNSVAVALMQCVASIGIHCLRILIRGSVRSVTVVLI